MARRRASVHGGATAHGATARSLRSGGVGPPQIRAALGMGLSVRGLHTCFEAQARVLRRLPLLWRDRVIGWANLALTNGKLHADLGYVSGGPPRERMFQQELDVELDRMRVFLKPAAAAR